MRRPSPLPAAPGSVASPPGRAGETPDPARRDPSSAEREGADLGASDPRAERTARYTRPASLDTALAGGTALDDPRVDAGDGSGVDVGVRDVWRAARARRKALRAEVRRFTARQRRRRAMWIGVGAALLLLVAGTFAAAYSPLFSVQRILVVGTHSLNPVTVAAALDGELGRPLPLVDDSAVKAALVTFPLVESYSLEARPPHDLVVRIVERTPVGAIRTAAGFTVVDAAGVALATTASAPAGQPLITATGGVHSDAFSSIGQVMRALPPAVRAQVTAVTASSPDAVTLTLGATRTSVVWGSADDSAKKALVLQRIMKARPPAGVRQYDVSTPDAVVVR